MAYIGQTAPVSLAADATVTNLTVTGTVDFDATGNIDGPVTGATTPAAGTFTTLQATALDSTPIGGTTPAAGTFTTLEATSLDSTPIGGTTPAAGTFTTAEADHYRIGNVSSGASGATLVPGQFFVSTASGQTVTLPASPSPGDTVYIGVQNFIDTVVGRNGEPIMSVAQDMTIDTVNATLTFTYIDSTIGWRVY
jgi:hypothetical protein